MRSLTYPDLRGLELVANVLRVELRPKLEFGIRLDVLRENLRRESREQGSKANRSDLAVQLQEGQISFVIDELYSKERLVAETQLCEHLWSLAAHRSINYQLVENLPLGSRCNFICFRCRNRLDNHSLWI
jgi:hypothetical protein